MPIGKPRAGIYDARMADPRSALTDALAAHVGVPPLTPDEIESVLELASVAAHGTGERTAAPLASFLAGMLAAGSADRLAALGEMRRIAEEATTPGAG